MLIYTDGVLLPHPKKIPSATKDLFLIPNGEVLYKFILHNFHKPENLNVFTDIFASALLYISQSIQKNKVIQKKCSAICVVLKRKKKSSLVYSHEAQGGYVKFRNTLHYFTKT